MSKEVNATEKKISVSEIMEAVRAEREEDGSFRFHGMDVTVKRVLTIEEMAQFVNDVVSGAFNDETNEYTPEFLELIRRAATISMYTNIELPDDAFDVYELVYSTDLYEKVICLIDQDAYVDMIDAIDEKVEHLAHAQLSELQLQIETIAARFEELSASLEALVGGVSSDDINKLAGAIIGGGLDEEKLVKAFAKQKIEIPAN